MPTRSLWLLCMVGVILVAIFAVVYDDNGAGSSGHAAQVPDDSRRAPELIDNAPMRVPNTASGVENRSTSFAPAVEPLRTPLAELFDIALVGKDPEVRSLAVEMASTCTAIDYLQSDSAKSAASPNEVEVLQISARKSFESYCRSGDSGKFMNALRAQPEPRLGYVGKGVHPWQAKERPQEYFQAITLLLANPKGHPVTFEIWLRTQATRAMAREFGLSSSQVSVARDEILGKYISSESYLTYYRLRDCAIDAECRNSELSAPERLKAQQAAEAVSQRIVEQRWNSLIPGKP